jgi:branched-chain amino acid transport system ATP-binding protein
MSPALEVKGLSSGYGNRIVISEIELYLDSSELVAVIGPNGAGKSTLISSLVNLVAHFGGDVMLDGASTKSWRPDEFVRRGMALVPQTGNVFSDMTVADHFKLAKVGARGRVPPGIDERVLGVFPLLSKRWRFRAGTLSGGEQQMLAVARALLTGPRVLLLDEPSKGLAPQIVDRLMDVIAATRDELGVASLIAEQDVEAVGRVCSRYYMLKVGRVAQTGPIGVGFREELASAYLV